MSETFQDWIQTTVRDYRNTPGMITGRLHPLTDYKAQEGAKLAWDHQQENIDELVEALEKCVFLLSSIGYTPENSVTAMVARDLIAKAKGD